MRELKTTKQILQLTYKIVVGKLYYCLPRNSNIFDALSAVTVSLNHTSNVLYHYRT